MQLKIASIIAEKLTLEHLNPLYHTEQMKTNSLKNHFLISMPKLTDEIFSQSVIFLCEHDKNGAMGIIVNKTLNVQLNEVLDHLGLKPTTSSLKKQPVFMGGPVGQENGFVIHSPYLIDEADDDLVVSASLNTLSDIANNTGPKQYLIALGYAGWDAGQLEEEITNNDWLLAPYDKDILFKNSPQTRWQSAIELLGFSHAQLSSQEGHA